MRTAIMLALQATQVAGPPTPADLTPKKPLPVAIRCGEPDESGDIVICARGKDANRLPQLPDRYVRVPARAETRVFGNARLSWKLSRDRSLTARRAHAQWCV